MVLVMMVVVMSDDSAGDDSAGDGVFGTFPTSDHKRGGKEYKERESTETE